MSTRRGRRTRPYHHGDLKSALIDAARAMLERDGPESISLRAAARDAGVSQTAPYNHFDGKDDLLATVATAGFRELEASQAAAAQQQRPIAALGLDYVRFARTHPQLYRLMFGVGVSDWCDHPEVADAKRATFAPIKTALLLHIGGSQPVEPEAIETVATAAWALVHGLAMLVIDRSLDRSDKDIDALVARVIELFVAGLGTPHAEAKT